MKTSTHTPIIIATSVIDEAARLVIENADGKVGRAATSDIQEELAALLVEVPKEAHLHMYPNGNAEIAITRDGITNYLYVRHSVNLAQSSISWNRLEILSR